MEERQPHEFHPNSFSGTSPSCSSGDHRPNFSGDPYPNHQSYYNSNQYHQQNYHHDRQFNNNNEHFHHPYPNPPHPVNNEHNEPFGGGGFRPNGGAGFASAQSIQSKGRKRSFHHGPGASPDQVDGCGHAKLYVAPIPRTAVVEDIRPVFEQHGNVIEVVLFRDKRTGQQQGACFVKYATLEDAERAIKVLHNQHSFSGDLGPIKIKFAGRERERHANWPRQEGGGGGNNFTTNWPRQEGGGNGNNFTTNWPRQEGGGNGSNFTTNWPRQEGGGNGSNFTSGAMDKLYVGNVHRQALNNDIEEIFSQFGFIEDVFIVRDDQKLSRGCAFVKYSLREMAIAAIKALNGTFTMRGCDQPLIVRFADPKKPRTGELRGNYPLGGPNLAPRSQEPSFRSASCLGDSSGGRILPNATYPEQQNYTSPNLQTVPQMPNQENAFPVFTPQMSQPHQLAPQLSQMPVQQTQTQYKGSQSSQQTDSEMQKQLRMRSSAQSSDQQQIMQNTKQESPQNGSTPQAVASPLPAVPASPQTAEPPECDWSEHTCPDGDKYYYNCVTRISRWEKPKEFALFEKQLKQQQDMLNPGKPFQSLLPDLSTQEVVQMQQEPDHVKLHSETSPVNGSICVQ